MCSKLRGEEIKELQEAILEAYPQENDLIMALTFANLDTNPMTIKGAYNYKIFNLIKDHEANKTTQYLLQELIRERPNTPLKEISDFLSDLYSDFSSHPNNEDEFLPKPTISQEGSKFLKELITILRNLKERDKNLVKNQTEKIFKIIFLPQELNKLNKNITDLECKYFLLFLKRLTQNLRCDFPNKSSYKLLFNFVLYLSTNEWEDHAKVQLSQLMQKMQTFRQEDIIKPLNELSEQSKTYYLIMCVIPESCNKFSLWFSLFEKINKKDKEIDLTLHLDREQKALKSLHSELDEKGLKNTIEKYIMDFMILMKIVNFSEATNKLFLEIFLPCNLIFQKIELKEIKLFGTLNFPITCHYPTNIRCYERYKYQENDTAQIYNLMLKDKWNTWKTLTNGKIKFYDELVFAPRERLDNYEKWKPLHLKWTSQENFILMILMLREQLSSKKSKINLLKFICECGIPILIWSKGENLNDLEWQERINNLLDTHDVINDVSELFTKIHRLSREMYGKEMTSINRSELGLLCDHPDRIPTFMQTMLIS